MISFCLMLLLKFRNAFLQTLFYKHTHSNEKKRREKKHGCYSRIMCITVRRFFIFISYIGIDVSIRPKRFRVIQKTHTHTAILFDQSFIKFALTTIITIRLFIIIISINIIIIFGHTIFI